MIVLNTKTFSESGRAFEAPGQEPASRLWRLFHMQSQQPGTFGERLRLLRKKRGLTQVQLGARTGLSPTAVAELELGVRSPAARDLHVVALALDVRIEQLLDGSVQP